MKKEDKPIIIENLFDVPAVKVWNALTVIDEMRGWYFSNIPDFKPVPGFRTEFDIKSEARNFRHIWIVKEVIPGKLIKYTWEFSGYPGKSATTFELEEKDGKTNLKLTVDVLADFPDDVPEFKTESCRAGWEYFIMQRLAEYLSIN